MPSLSRILSAFRVVPDAWLAALASGKAKCAHVTSRMTVGERWLAASLATAGTMVLCEMYVDRPLARALTSLRLLRRLLWAAPMDVPIFIIVAVVAIVFALGHRCSGRPAARWMTAATVAAMALIVSLAVTKYALKPIFGRIAPSAYLYQGRYGFRWFEGGNGLGSLPSAHAAEAAAAVSVFWVSHPRWRWAYVALLLPFMFLLMVGQWHYLSDLIGGLYVGAVVGTGTHAAWRALSMRHAPTG
jgi:membrane-associated phospholipid phosphatase